MGKTKVKKEKSRFVIRMEYFFFLIFYKVLEYLPIKLAMAFSSNLMKLVYFIDRRHTERTISHIMYAGFETDLRKAKALARANFEALHTEDHSARKTDFTKLRGKAAQSL